MPIYEYLCSKCGTTFEKIQKFSDDPIKIHEDCGGEVEKMLSAPAFQFKGTGWYVTDYAKGSAPGLASAKPKEGGGASSSESKESKESKDSKSTSTETKTAVTTTTTPASTTSSDKA